MRFVVAALASVFGWCLVCGDVSFLEVNNGEKEAPAKCCAPGAFEVEIKSTGNNDYGVQFLNKQILKLVYDYGNNRWMLNTTVPRNSSLNSRVIYDYNTGLKYLIDRTGCRVSPVAGKMQPFCVPENATYYGDYSYSRAGFSLPYSVWGWDIEGVPMRVMTKVTRDNCFPLQDDVYQMKDSVYTYYKENDPCIPWEIPKAAADGDCYKCYLQVPAKKNGTSVVHHVSHLQYANYFHGLHRDPYWDVPEDCREMDEWGLDAVYTSVQKFLIIRFKE